MLLWEVFSYGRTPYPSIVSTAPSYIHTPTHLLPAHSFTLPQPTDEVLEMLEDEIVMDPPDNCPEAMYSMMCGCWKIEPTDRPSFPKLQQALAKSGG